MDQRSRDSSTSMVWHEAESNATSSVATIVFSVGSRMFCSEAAASISVTHMFGMDYSEGYTPIHAEDVKAALVISV